MAFLNVDQLRFGQGEWQLAADFEIERHSLTVVIGASGAGKSTLLALIAGFEQATAGRIVLNGIDVTQLPPSSRSITTLFQDHNLFAHLSLKDNIALARHPGLKLSIDDWHQVDQAIARVGLENIAQRRPGEVSGGQAQRAALARCLCARNAHCYCWTNRLPGSTPPGEPRCLS
jgi:thiamine transport system ATP-binding protein